MFHDNTRDNLDRQISKIQMAKLDSPNVEKLFSALITTSSLESF